MRRRVLSVVVLALLLPFALAAKTGDIWLQMNMANNIYGGELWQYVPANYTTEKSGGGTGMQFRSAIEVVEGVTVGLSLEYHQIQDRNVQIGAFNVPLTAQAMPVLVSYQQYSGQLFVLFEAGACIWNGDKGGIDPSAAFGGGYTMPLAHWLNLNITARALAIFSDRLILPVSLAAGISFIL